MSLPAPFVYSQKSHERKHAPAGYEAYQDFKPWLRDEFTFRCVYCLEREMWYPDRANSFSADHVVSQRHDPARVCDYTNLLYACTRCNSLKGPVRLLDPVALAIGQHLSVEEDGNIRSLSKEGEFLIRQLHLNEKPAFDVRKNHFELLALKREYPNDPRVQGLFLQAFCYPDDLPNLVVLRPPAGNTLEPNKYSCHHALREKGLLGEVY